MAQDHRLPLQRFELKYLMDDSITSWMRDFLSSHLVPDDYAVGKPDFSYPVHTLYLDSDGLATYHASVNGTKNRFKLRLRYYDDQPQTPVFFEVKARVDNCILKTRCPVRRSAVPLLVAGQLPGPDDLLSREPRHLATLEHFNLLLHQLNARPKAHNHYMREAWVTPSDNTVRVTFDRRILIEPCFVAKAAVEMIRPVPVFPEFTVLELKFTERYPNWLQSLVRRFNCMQFSSAKYAEGVVLLGEESFHDGYQARDWTGLNPRELQPEPFPEDAPEEEEAA